MVRRLIGIDIDARHMRAVLIEESQGKRTLIDARREPRTEGEDPAESLRRLLGETRLGDRMATALPAGCTYFRRLSFPFAEEKKISAALPMAFSLQLPVTGESFGFAMEKAIPGEAGFTLAAAAVDRATIAATLEPFDRRDIPLNILGLTPHSHVRGLGEMMPDGLLAILGEAEGSLALVDGGAVVDHRLLPPAVLSDSVRLSEEMCRAGNALRAAHGLEHPAWLLIGSGATEHLVQALLEAGEAATTPRVELHGEPLPAEFLPAFALARRAGISERKRAFNLRTGEFALKSEWGRLKKRLAGMAALLGFSLLLLGVSAYLDYAQKARVAENLREEMHQLFRATFPDNQAIVDAPLQMRAQLEELRKISGLLGTGEGPSALFALDDISRRTPADLTVDIREFTYTAEAVRLEGITASFDAINRFSDSLRQSPLFAEVRIDDARMSLDGKQVDFRLTLPLRREP